MVRTCARWMARSLVRVRRLTTSKPRHVVRLLRLLVDEANLIAQAAFHACDNRVPRSDLGTHLPSLDASLATHAGAGLDGPRGPTPLDRIRNPPEREGRAGLGGRCDDHRRGDVAPGARGLGLGEAAHWRLHDAKTRAGLCRDQTPASHRIAADFLRNVWRARPAFVPAETSARSDGLPAVARVRFRASGGWRARQDSNLRPLAPEANALSS